jgi:hypothetical protein
MNARVPTALCFHIEFSEAESTRFHELCGVFSYIWIKRPKLSQGFPTKVRLELEDFRSAAMWGTLLHGRTKKHSIMWVGQVSHLGGAPPHCDPHTRHVP